MAGEGNCDASVDRAKTFRSLCSADQKMTYTNAR